MISHCSTIDDNVTIRCLLIDRLMERNFGNDPLRTYLTFVSFNTHPPTCRDFSLLYKQISRSTCRLFFYYITTSSCIFILNFIRVSLSYNATILVVNVSIIIIDIYIYFVIYCIKQDT